MAPLIQQAIVVLAAVFQLGLVTGTSLDKCAAFSTDGQAGSTFAFHRFYDFRNISRLNGPSSDVSADQHMISRTVSDYWQSDWTTTIGRKNAAQDGWAPILYSPDSISIENPSPASGAESSLTLMTTRLPNGTQQCGQLIYTEQSVTAMSLRVRARVSGDAGGVGAFFTYHNDTEETDIEIVTGDPVDRFHCSNQPTFDADGNPVPNATFNLSMIDTGVGQTWKDWNEYRIDWIPGNSVFYVNGKLATSTTVNVPTVETQIYLLMFGNGGTFSGDMREGGTAILEISWIDVVYNTSTSPTIPKGATSVCSVESMDFINSLPSPSSFPAGHISSGLSLKVSFGLMAVFAVVSLF